MNNQINIVGIEDAARELPSFKSMVGDIKNFVIFYHGRCNDGTVAAYAAERGLEKQFGEGLAIYSKAVSYGDKTIEDYLEPFKALIDGGKGVAFLVVDFCFSDKELEVLSRLSQAVLVLDHHKTALEDMKNSQVVFDPSVLLVFADDNCMSGAGMAWRFFNPDSSLPELISCVENHDLWHNDIPFVEEANLFVRNNHSSGRHVFDKACSSRTEFEASVTPYASAVQYRKEICKSIASGAQYTTISLPFFAAEEGEEEYPDEVYYNVAIVNCHPQFASDVGDILYRTPMIDAETLPPFALMYHLEHDHEGNTKAKLSLRSLKGEGADVGAIAKHLGGGGHTNAAGAVIDAGDLFDMIGAWLLSGESDEQEEDDGLEAQSESFFQSTSFFWYLLTGLALLIVASRV